MLSEMIFSSIYFDLEWGRFVVVSVCGSESSDYFKKTVTFFYLVHVLLSQ